VLGAGGLSRSGSAGQARPGKVNRTDATALLTALAHLALV